MVGQQQLFFLAFFTLPPQEQEQLQEQLPEQLQEQPFLDFFTLPPQEQEQLQESLQEQLQEQLQLFFLPNAWASFPPRNDRPSMTVQTAIKPRTLRLISNPPS